MVDMVHPSSKRLRNARLNAGISSMAEAARRFGWNPSTYRSHENGQTPVPPEDAEKYARAYRTKPELILFEDGSLPPSKGRPSNGKPAGAMMEPFGRHRAPEPENRTSARRISAYGPARAGEETLGFTEEAEPIDCPPALLGDPDAYAVYVAGDSMEDRYYEGELVYVSTKKPPKKGSFVVVQFTDAPEGLVKRLVAWTGKSLILEQLNPKKRIEIDRKRVKSVHRIVMGGDGS